MRLSAWNCSSSLQSTKACPCPLRSWIAPGHQSAHTTFAPPRSTPLALPSSIACASRASQFPSGEFGDPTKLQPQPGSQLHASRYVPAIRQVLT